MLAMNLLNHEAVRKLIAHPKLQSAMASAFSASVRARRGIDEAKAKAAHAFGLLSADERREIQRNLERWERRERRSR
ncbi:MAG: hypothetical protein RBU37_11370 [Myxococcota bacterium]|jgi:hypothetical protein|nr:hypothetical protein [Myxococcota bacterium]